MRNFLIDSGSCRHISNQLSSFTELYDIPPTIISYGSGEQLQAQKRGHIFFKCRRPDGSINEFYLKDVLFVPEFATNVISVSQPVKQGFEWHGSNNKCFITKDGQICLVGAESKGLYTIDVPPTMESEDKDEGNSVLPEFSTHGLCKVNTAPSCNHINHIQLVHHLFHRNYESTLDVQRKQLTEEFEFMSCDSTTNKCECCLVSKAVQKPFPKQTAELLDRIHSDICGPLPPIIGKFHYFLSFIDDFTKYAVVFRLREKSEALQYFKTYVRMVSNKFGRKPKVLHRDRGGEYLS